LSRKLQLEAAALILRRPRPNQVNGTRACAYREHRESNYAGAAAGLEAQRQDWWGQPPDGFMEKLVGRVGIDPMDLRKQAAPSQTVLDRNPLA
jgi:hypothetical protein